MTPELDDYARHVAGAVSALGGGFMISSQARGFSKAMGLRGRPAYALGRLSVLGPVHPDVVVAVVGFWRPELIAASWAAALVEVDPAQAVEPYIGAAREWGRERLAALDAIRSARLADLIWQVVDAADIVGAPLAAAWRAVRRDPADTKGDAIHGLHVLREHRAAMHLAAVLASGLTPLQAILAGVGGEGNAGFFGWEPPYPDVSDLRELRDAAERVTDALAGRVWASLTPPARAELADLLAAAAS